jgi:hypothetical protein
MTNMTSIEALRHTGEELHAADAALREAEAQFTQSEIEFAQLSREALALKGNWYDAFIKAAELSWRVNDLAQAIDRYNTDKKRALTERNLAGDDLDRVARLQGSDGYGVDDLERAAIRYAAAQKVLDCFQRGSELEKFRQNNIALKEASAELTTLDADTAAKKAVFDAETVKETEGNDRMEVWRGTVVRCYQEFDRCQKALRQAALAYAATLNCCD